MKKVLFLLFLFFALNANSIVQIGGSSGGNCENTACSLGGDDVWTNAANVTGGTLVDARLSTNVCLLNTVQTFSAGKIFSGDVNVLGRINAVDINFGNGTNWSGKTITIRNNDLNFIIDTNTKVFRITKGAGTGQAFWEVKTNASEDWVEQRMEGLFVQNTWIDKNTISEFWIDSTYGKLDPDDYGIGSDGSIAFDVLQAVYPTTTLATDLGSANFKWRGLFVRDVNATVADFSSGRLFVGSTNYAIADLNRNVLTVCSGDANSVLNSQGQCLNASNWYLSGNTYSGISPITVDNANNFIGLNVLPTSDWNGTFDGQQGSYYLNWINSNNRLFSLLSLDSNNSFDARYLNEGDYNVSTLVGGTFGAGNFIFTGNISLLLGRANIYDLNVGGAGIRNNSLVYAFPDLNRSAPANCGSDSNSVLNSQGTCVSISDFHLTGGGASDVNNTDISPNFVQVDANLMADGNVVIAKRLRVDQNVNVRADIIIDQGKRTCYSPTCSPNIYYDGTKLIITGG